MVYSPATVARPAAQPAAHVQLTPGKHLALAMIPVGGATERAPRAVRDPRGQGPGTGRDRELLDAAPGWRANRGCGQRSGRGRLGHDELCRRRHQAAPAGAPVRPALRQPQERPPPTLTDGAAFPFTLPSTPGPGGTQALAENTTNGGVTYDVAYSVVTVNNGAPVTNTNSAYALAHCQGCTTVAVSFQIVLIVGQSKDIAPINAAGSLNYDCPACTTTAIADQLVVTLRAPADGSVAGEACRCRAEAVEHRCRRWAPREPPQPSRRR